MIYIDELRDYGWRQGKSCHMFIVDGTIRDLKNFAYDAGIGKSYFHDVPGFPHFDLTALNRHRALAAGAMEITSREAVTLRRAGETNGKSRFRDK